MTQINEFNITEEELNKLKEQGFIIEIIEEY